MSSERSAARLTGILYLVTFVTSIPALALKQPFLQGWAGGDPDAVRWAAVLELVLAAACVGTAVAMYPILGRHSPRAAIGFVASRAVEAGIIALGVVAMLATVTLRNAGDPAATLVAVHDWAFLVGPGLLPGVNALLIAPVLLRTGLVPRVIALTGIVGAPLLLVTALGVVLGWFSQVSAWGAFGALPIALWELSLGIWLAIMGAQTNPGAKRSQRGAGRRTGQLSA